MKRFAMLRPSMGDDELQLGAFTILEAVSLETAHGLVKGPRIILSESDCLRMAHCLADTAMTPGASDANDHNDQAAS